MSDAGVGSSHYDVGMNTSLTHFMTAYLVADGVPKSTETGGTHQTSASPLVTPLIVIGHGRPDLRYVAPFIT